MSSQFAIKDLKLEGVKLITPFYVEDNRGYFMKSLERGVFADWGLKADIYEEFESYSRKGVIRGMHFQTQHPQVKIVRAIRGTIHDIVVDLRKGSQTFGKYADVLLSDENHYSLWVPEGFAHGFEVLSDDAIMSYKCVGKYLSGYDSGIYYNDKNLALPWKTEHPVVSQKDSELQSLDEFIKTYEGLEG